MFCQKIQFFYQNPHHHHRHHHHNVCKIRWRSSWRGPTSRQSCTSKWWRCRPPMWWTSIVCSQGHWTSSEISTSEWLNGSFLFRRNASTLCARGKFCQSDRTSLGRHRWTSGNFKGGQFYFSCDMICPQFDLTPIMLTGWAWGLLCLPRIHQRLGWHIRDAIRAPPFGLAWDFPDEVFQQVCWPANTLSQRRDFVRDAAQHWDAQGKTNNETTKKI